MSSVATDPTRPRVNHHISKRVPRPAEVSAGQGPVELLHLRDAWVYKRLSSHEQRKHNIWSVMQQDDLEKMASAEGYSTPLTALETESLKADPDYPGYYVNGQIHIEERDIGISGTKNHRFRPGLAALIDAIKADQVEAVYVVHISRLYRDQTLIDAMTFADLCKRHHVAIVTPQMAFDLNQELHFDIFKMEVENAVRELKVMRLRLTGNKLLKARHGYYDGRGIAWGYILNFDRESAAYQKPVPYEPHAAVIREIFRLALSYRTANRVRQHLLEHETFFESFPPEIAAKLGGRHSIKSSTLRPDGSWLPGRAAMLSILTNPAYIGWWLVKGEVIDKANHPAIVDEQTFWAVQEIWNPVDYRTGESNPSYSFNAGRATGRRALLTGLLYCGQHPEDGEWSRHYLCASFGKVLKNGGQQNWYRCSLDHDQDERCPACFHTRQNPIDEAILEHVLERLDLAQLAEEVLERIQEEGGRDRTESRRRKSASDQLKREIDGLKKKLPWAETKPDYDLLMAEIHQREQLIEQNSRSGSTAAEVLTAVQVKDVVAFLRTIRKEWSRVKHETKRWFLGILIDRITVYHDASDMLYLHLRWTSGLTDILRVHRVHPPRPQGWRWDAWEDEAIQAYYPTCADVTEVLSRVKPFRVWGGVKQRASLLGIHRALPEPPEGVAEHSQPSYEKKRVERKPAEYLGSYDESSRQQWVSKAVRAESWHAAAMRNMGTDASSRCDE